jgi:hypothetical protein
MLKLPISMALYQVAVGEVALSVVAEVAAAVVTKSLEVQLVARALQTQGQVVVVADCLRSLTYQPVAQEAERVHTLKL